MADYIALVRKTPDTDFAVSFPDLPGCVTTGREFDDAFVDAREALALHLEGMAAEGEPIPAPSRFEEILADPDNRDALAMIVHGPDTAIPVRRINATLPEDVIADIDAVTDNRSGFLADAARTQLAKVVRNSGTGRILRAARKRGRPGKRTA